MRITYPSFVNTNSFLITNAGLASAKSTKVIKRFLQNLGTNPVYVKLNAAAAANAATANAADFILPAAAAQDDGSVAPMEITEFRGAIYIAGTTPRVLVSEAYTQA